jgi:hypothetical protein
MMTVPRRWICLLAAAAALTGCGGGGDPSNRTPSNVAGAASATGLWQGTFSPSDGTARGFSLLIAPDGRFAGVVDSTSLNGRLLLGTATTVLSSVSGSGKVFAQAGEKLLPNGESSDLLTLSNGALVARVSLSGTLSGGGESATFALTYEDTRDASLQSIAGVYGGYPIDNRRVPSSTLTVNGNALTWANDSGCNGAGNIEVIDPGLNMYSWSMLLAGCSGAPDHTILGLGTLGSDPLSASGLQLRLYGATATNELPFVFLGFK